MFEDTPEGYMRFEDEVYVDGIPVERLAVEIWKAGNVWKWSVTRTSDGDGLFGTADSRGGAIDKALDAFERMKKEIKGIEREIIEALSHKKGDEK